MRWAPTSYLLAVWLERVRRIDDEIIAEPNGPEAETRAEDRVAQGMLSLGYQAVLEHEGRFARHLGALQQHGNDPHAALQGANDFLAYPVLRAVQAAFATRITLVQPLAAHQDQHRPLASTLHRQPVESRVA